MPSNIFIMMENPASWLGDKTDNLPRSPSYTSGNISREHQKYVSRQKVLSLNEVRNDTAILKERQQVLALFDKHDAFGEGNKVGVAASGSLPSMLKRMRNYAATEGKVDTLVFIGHGCASNLATGSGQYTFRDENRELFKADAREITLENSTSWVPAFDAVKDSLAPGVDGRIHVFLLGCSTGKAGSLFGREQALTQVLADKLLSIFNVPVSVYGTAKKLGATETAGVLKKLIKIEAEWQYELTVGGVTIYRADADP